MEDNDISRNLIKNGFPIKLEVQNNKVYFSYILERELFKEYEWKFQRVLTQGEKICTSNV